MDHCPKKMSLGSSRGIQSTFRKQIVGSSSGKTAFSSKSIPKRFKADKVLFVERQRHLSQRELHLNPPCSQSPGHKNEACAARQVLRAKPHFRAKKAEKTSFGEGHEAQFWSQKGCSKAKESRKLPRWKRKILKGVQESKMDWVN